MKKVIIAEKPSMKKKLEAALSNISGIEVTCSIGHIEALAPPHYYLHSPGSEIPGWTQLSEKFPFVPKEFVLEITNQSQYKEIKNCVKDAQEIILACDPDREGELIHRNILELLTKEGVIKTNNITRIWLHSETQQGILEGFEKRKPYKEFEGYYQAARTRTIVDWLMGIQFTVLYSVKFSKPGEPLSIGRVQSWLLSEICKRTIDFENFKSKDYGLIKFISNKGIVFKNIDEEKKERKHFDLATFEEKVKRLQGKNLNITNVETKPFTEYAPALYDLNSLSRDAARIFGFSPDTTLSIAQNLYESKEIISYPRTDCNILSAQEAEQIKHSINLIGKFEDYNEIANLVQKRNPNFTLNKKYIGEIKGHFAIIPVFNYHKGTIPTLNEDERKIFSLIVKRVCAVLLPPLKGEKTTIEGNIADDQFYSEIKNVIEKGYKEISGFDNEENEEEKNEFQIDIKNGEILTGNIEAKREKTKPEPLFKDESILALMEKAHLTIEDEILRGKLKEANGIGTAATRASFIPLLIKRGYITKKGKSYIPTQKGYDVYKVLPDELKKADFSAKMEYELSMIIEKNGIEKNELISETYDFMKNIFEKVLSSKEVFENKKLGVCPKCGSEIIEEKFTFSCSKRKEGSCDFVVNRVIAKKNITTEILKELIEKRKTKKMKGFVSTKTGKKFEASLKLNDTNKVEFEF